MNIIWLRTVIFNKKNLILYKIFIIINLSSRFKKILICANFDEFQTYLDLVMLKSFYANKIAKHRSDISIVKNTVKFF